MTGLDRRAEGVAPPVDVVLPVLDEAAALPWVLERMPAGYRAIVVDNGSTDGSSAIARALGAEVVSARRKGFGSACWVGLNASRAPVVCFMDCDASLDPAELPALVAPVLDGSAELVLGGRVADRGAMALHARVANRYLAWAMRRRYGFALTDLGPMRATHREALLGLGMQDRRSGWPLEMVLRAGAAGWRVIEVPVAYRAREGKSKVTGTIGGTVRAVRDMRRQLRAFR